MRGTLALALAMICSTSLLGGCDTGQSEDLETTPSHIVGGWFEPGMEYAVAILENGDAVCTGTLVDTRLVVTAGHCVSGPLGTLEVFFGPNANWLNTGTVVDVASYQAYPSFDLWSLDHDIGVIELAEDAPVTPAAMLPAGVFGNGYVGTELRFVGYGSTHWIGFGYGRKRAVDIEVDAVDSSTFTYYDNTHQTCFGDSGGGAFADHDGQWQLIGITSWGDPYCNQYGVDTRVDAYLSWIEGFMGGGGGEDPDPADGDELTIATSVSGSLDLDEEIYFWFETQADQQYDVIVETTSDADLYTHPTGDIGQGTYTCRPYLEGGETEVCTISGAGSGIYWVMIHGYEASSYDIVVVESPESCRQYFNGHPWHCTGGCPCGYGHAHCTNDNQCADGLSCSLHVGGDYGLPNMANVCTL